MTVSGAHPDDQHSVQEITHVEGEAGTQPDKPGKLTPTGTVIQSPAEVVQRAARSTVEIRPTNRPTVPGYEIECELGRGAMGVVYKGRQLRLNRPAAIKMILGGVYQDPTARVRFLIEAEAFAAMDHPHIVGVYEFGTHDELPFFAMEFVGGGTLAQKLRREGRFSPTDAVGMVARLADGMAAAHAKGIVHRDLKPANVLLTEAGEPKVADFGLAKIGRSDMTVSGAVMGTPSYMSPEQAAGRTRDVGTSSDIWALGAILYDLLTGRPPFGGETTEATLEQVLTHEPDRPRAIDPTIPRDLETICLKCLEKEPRKRYPTADALAVDLRAFFDGKPIMARPVGSLERLWKWTKRHPRRAIGITVGLLLTLGLVVAANEVQKQRVADRLESETKRADDRIAAEKRLTEEVRRKERETRATSLVEALTSAETAGVPRLIEELAEFRDLTRTQLHAFAGQPVGTKLGLRARLALLAEEPERLGELTAYLPTCRPEELLPIRALLKPHSAAVAPELWGVLSDMHTEPGSRVRAACLLAGLAPGDQRWGDVVGGVVEAVVRGSPIEFGVWSEALRPVQDGLVPTLVKRYAESQTRIKSDKLSEVGLAAEVSSLDLTASLLAQYTTDRPVELSELMMTVDAHHHRLFERSVSANRAAVVPILQAELRKSAIPGGVVGPAVATAVGGPMAVAVLLDPDPVFDALAKRQANAAAVLLALGEFEAVWPLFRFPADGDPSTRSYFLKRLAAISADPVVLIRRFRDEAEVSARRGLLIALGDFPLTDRWARERDTLTMELLSLYREHPDPGLHGAIDWLLRQKWGKATELAGIDRELRSVSRGRVVARAVFGAVPRVGFVGVMGVACGPLLPAPRVGRDRDWYVNGEGQTYAVVRGPVKFTLGSPDTEPGRVPINEPAHPKRIERSFAIATKEVTIEQFRRFRPQFRGGLARYSPDRDGPAVGLRWYDAAAYCNWLSECEGVPPEQWCYEPNDRGLCDEGMQIKPHHLKLRGYRLPTEAEWEYACRAGSVTSRYFGRTAELLPRYGWILKNAGDRAWPVGQLRPNEVGLFDALGNAAEWVEDPAQLYMTGQQDDVDNLRFEVIHNQRLCLFRGGSFYDMPAYSRSANRSGQSPSNPLNSMGFRACRTVLD
jgi:formylglycine-generating enzyme required for sulfatase activity